MSTDATDGVLEKKLDDLKIDDDKKAVVKSVEETESKDVEGGEVEAATKPRRRPRFVSKSQMCKEWEERKKGKTLVESGIKGTVKWYSVSNRYGFVSRDDGKGDIFIHQSAISVSKMKLPHLRTLDTDEKILFDVVQGDKGLEASNISGPEGEPVQGSKYRVFYPRRPRDRKSRKTDAAVKEGDVEQKENGAVDGEEKNVTPAEKEEKSKKRRGYNSLRRNKKDESAEKKVEDDVEPKPVKNRKHRTSYNRRRRNTGKNDAVKDESAPVEQSKAEPEAELAGARRRTDSQTDDQLAETRCESALGGDGDAALGAELEDAQTAQV